MADSLTSAMSRGLAIHNRDSLETGAGGCSYAPRATYIGDDEVLYWRVHNWDKWQTYRNDRSQPPWIKLHREILRNPHWVKMSDSQRGQLISIWILAADNFGLIPADEQLITRLCYMTEPLSVEFLMDCGFIERDAKLAPEWRQDDANVTPQSRVEKKQNKNTPLPPKGGYHEAVHEAAVAVTGYINSKYGKRRKPDNATLLKAISLVIKAGHSPDDVLKVVKYRTTKQDWYDPDKYGIESLIRAGGFASELERATETAAPKTVWLT